VRGPHIETKKSTLFYTRFVLVGLLFCVFFSGGVVALATILPYLVLHVQFLTILLHLVHCLNFSI
jgi:hypothetical protein